MKRMQVGNVEVIALSDGSIQPPAAALFPETPAEAWEPYRAEHLDAEGKLNMQFGAFLLRSDGQNVLVDTGLGGNAAGWGATPGRFARELDAAGVRPEEVALVLITHMHGDHIGGCTVQRGDDFVPAYPQARYLIDRSDWSHFTGIEEEKRAMERTAWPIERAGQLVLTDGEHAATAQLTMLPTPGHTPGHISVLISSNGERAVILGDVSHTPVQVTEPSWVISGDHDGALAVATRTALFERIEREELRVAAGHYGNGTFGRFVRLGGKRMWQGIG